MKSRKSILLGAMASIILLTRLVTSSEACELFSDPLSNEDIAFLAQERPFKSIFEYQNRVACTKNEITALKSMPAGNEWLKIRAQIQAYEYHLTLIEYAKRKSGVINPHLSPENIKQHRQKIEALALEIEKNTAQYNRDMAIVKKFDLDPERQDKIRELGEIMSRSHKDWQDAEGKVRDTALLFRLSSYYRNSKSTAEAALRRRDEASQKQQELMNSDPVSVERSRMHAISAKNVELWNQRNALIELLELQESYDKFNS